MKQLSGEEIMYSLKITHEDLYHKLLQGGSPYVTYVPEEDHDSLYDNMFDFLDYYIDGTDDGDELYDHLTNEFRSYTILDKMPLTLMKI